MKRILFYVLLLFQISAVLLIALQYNLIDKYGEERTFITKAYEDEYYVEDDIQDYEMYTFEFEINNIPKDKLEGKKHYDYRAQVYVLLKENESGVYEVVKASDKEVTTDQADEIVLIGKDIYESEENVYHVSYGFETINVKAHKKLFTDYKPLEATKVTYKFAPWNQSKIVSFE